MVSPGSIEYFLEAELRYARGGSIATSRATCCIVLRHTPIEPPLLDHDLKRYPSTLTVQSQRLMPGMQDANLSLRQKTHKFFGSFKVPKFTYKMEVGVPEKVQLDHPVPMSFTVKIIPVPDKTSESIRGVVQRIQIHTLKLSVKAMTDFRAPGNYNVNNVHYDHDSQVHTVLLSDAFNIKTPIVFSVGEGSGEK